MLSSKLFRTYAKVALTVSVRRSEVIYPFAYSVEAQNGSDGVRVIEYNNATSIVNIRIFSMLITLFFYRVSNLRFYTIYSLLSTPSLLPL